MAVLETLVPKRTLTIGKLKRWWSNLGIIVIDALVLRFLLPTAAVGVALWGQNQQFGLLYYVSCPFYIAVPLSIILLDFVIYIQHVMFHALPLLWRIHRVHHVDMDIDVTTGLRFHPLEILLSMLIKFAFVLLIGAPPTAVLLFEVILNATAMFNHSNIAVYKRVDDYLRWFIVTPDMHRVHHSAYFEETDRNFGFNLSIWDRIFGTYKAQPIKGHQNMTIGLENFKDPKQTQKLSRMLWLPFIKKR